MRLSALYTTFISVLLPAFLCAQSVSAETQEHAVDSLRVPAGLGVVDTVYRSSSDKLVIHIQDAHCYYPVQRQIVELITHFASHYGIEHILVEGADSPVEAPEIASFPDDKIRTAVADYFLKEGKISGVEYLVLSDIFPVTASGVEDRTLYQSNYEAFTQALAMNDYVSKEALFFRDKLSSLKNGIYSASLRDFDSAETAYHTGDRTVREYVTMLAASAAQYGVDTSEFDQIALLNRIMVLEKSFDYAAIEQEKLKLTARLHRLVSTEHKTQLVSATLQFSLNKMSAFDFFSDLDRLRELYEISSSEYPVIRDYKDYLSLSADLKYSELQPELDAFAAKLRSALETNDAERALYSLDRLLMLVKRVCMLKASSEELAEFRTRRQWFTDSFAGNASHPLYSRLGEETAAGISALLDQLEKVLVFYDQAVKRDAVLVNNTVGYITEHNLSAVVLVTGGFHSRGIYNQLKEQGISVVAVRPSIQDDTSAGSRYQSVILGYKNQLEDYLISRSQALAAALALVRGEPLVQAWKSDVYSREMALMALVIKLASIRMELERTLGVSSAEALTDQIAARIAEELSDTSGSFLKLWNKKYTEIAAGEHPYVGSMDVSVRFTDNELYAVIRIDESEIIFPITPEYLVDPGAVVHSYLTPERFTRLAAGDVNIREKVVSVDQLKSLRQRIDELLISPETAIESISEDDRYLVRAIVSALAESAPQPVRQALQDISQKSTVQDVADIIQKELFRARLQNIADRLERTVEYGNLLDMVSYGTTAPLRVFARGMDNFEPELAAFSRYVIDHFWLFNEVQDQKAAEEILTDLFDLYVSSERVLKGPVQMNADMMERLAKLVLASLKLGDSIRPHGIVLALVYSLSERNDMSFGQFMMMHDLFEQESVYSVDEVITLLFNSRYSSEIITSVLIESPMPYPNLIDLLTSDEFASLYYNPTPYTLSRFKAAYSALITTEQQLKIFTANLDPNSSLKQALDLVIVNGFKPGVTDDKFAALSARYRDQELAEKRDRLAFDMVVMVLTGSVPPAVSEQAVSKAVRGISSFEQFDFKSPEYNKTLSESVFQYIEKSGNIINVVSAHVDYSGLMTTPLGITVDEARYRAVLAGFLQSNPHVTFLVVDAEQVKTTREWLAALNPESLVVLLPLDRKRGDLVINAEKHLDFLGYWFNFVDTLSKKFRGRINLIGVDDKISSRLDSFGREYPAYESFLVQYTTLADEEIMLIAGKGDKQTITSLIRNGNLNEAQLNALVANQNFAEDVLALLLETGSNSLTNDIYNAIARKFHPNELEKVFTRVQNVRAVSLFNTIARINPSDIGSLISRVPEDKMAALAALAYKHGFYYTEANQSKWAHAPAMVKFVNALTALSPAAAPMFITAEFQRDRKNANEILENLGEIKDNQNAVEEVFTTFVQGLTSVSPDFQELIPFIQSDIYPLWHKSFVIRQALRHIDNPDTLHQYIYAILETFNEQAEFSDWIQLNVAKHEDRVHEWMKVVSYFPQIRELRAPVLLTAAIMTDKHILVKYREFISNLAANKELYENLLSDMDSFRLVLQAVNRIFSLPIETKMFVFNIVPFIYDFLPQGMTLEEIFEDYVEKTNAEGDVLKPGIPLSSILQVLVFAEGDTLILNSFKNLFSASFISSSRATKTQMASHFLRVFSQMDQASLFEAAPAEHRGTPDFHKVLLLSTPLEDKNAILKRWELKSYRIDHIVEPYAVAKRKHAILKGLARFSVRNFITVDQKSLGDVIDFMFILCENYPLLEKNAPELKTALDTIIDSIDSYAKVRDLQQAVIDLFARFIVLDFPDVFLDENDLREKMPRIMQVSNYWKYTLQWQDDAPKSAALLRTAVRDYLKDGMSLKNMKYGGTPESRMQMELYASVLTARFKQQLIAQENMPDTQAEATAKRYADIYVNNWKRDLRERVDLKQYPSLNRDETIVAWTSDEVPDWLNFGLSGGCTCLAPGNIETYTKNLPGYMMSGLVTGGLYFGKYNGDYRDRVNQGLLPVQVGTDTDMYLVNQYYYSSGGPIGEDIGIASIIMALRNAARYGAAGVIIPAGSPQAGYFHQMEQFIREEFSTVVTVEDKTGVPAIAEEITVENIDYQGVNLIVPKEPNQWRYFDACDMVSGRFSEKLDPNFSFVDFNDSVPQEVAGMTFDGLKVETRAIIITLNRRALPVQPAVGERAPASEPDSFKDYRAQERLVVLSEINAGVNTSFSKIAASDKTTGQYLNQVLKIGEEIARELDSRYIERNTKQPFEIIAVNSASVPIGRKINEMLEGMEVRSQSLEDLRNAGTMLPPVPDGATVFAVYESLLTSASVESGIEEIIRQDVAIDNIVVISLTADPKVVDRLFRKYPGVRIVTGMFEQRMEEKGSVGSTVLDGFAAKTQPLNLGAQDRVKVGGVEYKVYNRIQRGKSFIVYIAENPEGERVVLKSSVSADEGRRFLTIGKLVDDADENPGIPEVHQYDEKTGVLVSTYITGPTLAKYLQTTSDLPVEVALTVLNAVRDMIGIAEFLNENNALFANFTENNLHLDEKTGRWFLTNYTPFPYRVTPLSEKGVLDQINWIIQDVVRQIEQQRTVISLRDRKGVGILKALNSALSNGEISTLAKLKSDAAFFTTQILDIETLSKELELDSRERYMLNTIIESRPDTVHVAMGVLYDLIRTPGYTVPQIKGLLNVLFSFERMTPESKNSFILDRFATVLETVMRQFGQREDIQYLLLHDTRSMLDDFYVERKLTSRELGLLLRSLQEYKTGMRDTLESVINSIESGKPVILAGRLELIKWFSTEIYDRLGQDGLSHVFVIGELTEVSRNDYPVIRALDAEIVSAENIFFYERIRRLDTEVSVTEANMLDLDELLNVTSSGIEGLEHVRQRLLKNPGLTLLVRLQNETPVGLLFSSLQSEVSPQTARRLPASDYHGKQLFTYSTLVHQGYNNSKYRALMLDVETSFGYKMHFPEIYHHLPLERFIDYIILYGIMPALDSRGTTDIVLKTLAERNDKSALMYLFAPGLPPSYEEVLQKASDYFWDTDYQRVREILYTAGSDQFLFTIIKSILLQAVAEAQNTLPETAPDHIVAALSGVKVSVFSYLTHSLEEPLLSPAEIRERYDAYHKYAVENVPGQKPMDEHAFAAILKSGSGAGAFLAWIQHHYPDEYPVIESMMSADIRSVSRENTEMFGSFLLHFLKSTGKPMLETELSTNIADTEGIITHVFDSAWKDPLNPSQNINSMATGIALRIPYREMNIDRFLYAWFHADLVHKIQALLTSVTPQSRDAVIAQLTNMDIEKRYASFDRLLQALFSSPLSYEDIAALLTRDLKHLLPVLDSLSGTYDTRFVFLNADTISADKTSELVSDDPSVFYILIGSYSRARQMYNRIVSLNSDDIIDRNRSNARIAGYVPFMPDMPARINRDPQSPLISFAAFDDHVMSSTVLAESLLPEQTLFTRENYLLALELNSYVNASLGYGGVLSLLAEQSGYMVSDVTGYAISHHFSNNDATFQILKVNYGDDTRLYLIKAQITTPGLYKEHVIQRQQVPASYTPDNHIPVAASTMARLEEDKAIELTFFGEIPESSALITAALPPGHQLSQTADTIPAGTAVRSVMGAVTRIWHEQGILPSLRMESYLSTGKAPFTTAAVLYDPAETQPVTDGVSFIYELIRHGIMPFAVAQHLQANWDMGQAVPLTIRIDIIEGMIDGLNGDTALFERLFGSLTVEPFSHVIAHDIANYIVQRLGGRISTEQAASLRNAIIKQLRQTTLQGRPFNASQFDGFDIVSQYPDIIEDAVVYANRQFFKVRDTIKAIYAYRQNNGTTFMYSPVSQAVTALELRLPEAESLDELADVSGELVRELAETRQALPSHLIYTRMRLTLSIVQPDISIDDTARAANKFSDPAVYSVISAIHRGFMEDPVSLLKIVQRTAREYNRDADELLAMVLPDYNPENKTFLLGTTVVQLSALPDLLDVEKIIAQKPLVVVGDSSSLNFQLFETVKSVFAIPPVSVGQVLSEYSYTSGTEEAGVRELALRQWVSNQKSTFLLDMADEDNRALVHYKQRANVFDIRNISTLSGFLAALRERFDTDEIDRMRFDLSAIEDSLSALNPDSRNQVADLVREALRVRVALEQAEHGEPEALREYYAAAEYAGIQKQADTILLQRNNRSAGMEISTAIILALRTSGKFPEFSDLVSVLFKENAADTARFALLVETYSTLAIEYFARQVEQFSAEGDVMVNPDAATIERGGKVLVSLEDDYQYILSLLRSARINLKTFEKGTPADTVISFANAVKARSPLYADTLTRDINNRADIVDALDITPASLKRTIRERRTTVLDSSL